MKRNRLLRKRRKRREYVPPVAFAFPKPAGRKYDAEFLDGVHQLRCLLTDVPGHRCDGPVQADHAGRRPLGRKSDDDETIPLCPGAHRERQTATGWMDGVDERGMRLVLTTAIAETQQRVASMRRAA